MLVVFFSKISGSSGPHWTHNSSTPESETKSLALIPSFSAISSLSMDNRYLLYQCRRTSPVIRSQGGDDDLKQKEPGWDCLNAAAQVAATSLQILKMNYHHVWGVEGGRVPSC
ncbi:hypothetical protein Adt_44301 [Abeliophyllum distichum]|uniref:Uncharacterized protein n=1 Tax=Abeliophyllum distichum TaxID=126358 RepID=A0ABD1PAG0_9LAMI